VVEEDGSEGSEGTDEESDPRIKKERSGDEVTLDQIKQAEAAV